MKIYTEIFSLSKNRNELKIMVTKNTKVKDWYVEYNPTEFSLEYMNPEITFEQIYERPDLVYYLLNSGESVVRVKVFDILCELYNCEYNFIYLRWLYGNKEGCEKYINEAQQICDKLKYKNAPKATYTPKVIYTN